MFRDILPACYKASGKFQAFYPTDLKGCQDIVFTHGIWLGGLADGQEKVCPGCISETVRCRTLKLGSDIG